jgi:glutamyl-tRNA synthetase
MSVRVRFAPSPTGPLHIGGLRTALYNYLFARSQGGQFILRIEDTDQKRRIDGAEEYIIEALRWSGIQPDEGPQSGGTYGPYRQSERRAIYQRHVQRLLGAGHAYYAFDTPEELEQMRTAHAKYDYTNRMRMRNSLSMPAAEVERLLATGNPVTVRFKIPSESEVTFDDSVRETITFDTRELDDKVILKADGLPTYHLANVVDDQLMEITHVIRGEEWLSSTALHVLLYRAFAWEAPVFAHLPLILKPTGKGKLSKRDGAKFGFPVFPLAWHESDSQAMGFREMGFLPGAMLNFLALLGWNPGTEKEIFSLDELAEAFSLDRIIKSGARFDFDKATWFNSQYIQAHDDAQLADIVGPLLRKAGRSDFDRDFLVAYCALLKSRVRYLPDFVTEGEFLFQPPAVYEMTTVDKKWTPELSDHFNALNNRIAGIDHFTKEKVEAVIKAYIKEHSLKFGNVLPLLRVCVSGVSAGPDVFAMLALLGKDPVHDRIAAAIPHFNTIKENSDA